MLANVYLLSLARVYFMWFQGLKEIRRVSGSHGASVTRNKLSSWKTLRGRHEPGSNSCCLPKIVSDLTAASSRVKPLLPPQTCLADSYCVNPQVLSQGAESFSVAQLKHGFVTEAKFIQEMFREHLLLLRLLLTITCPTSSCDSSWTSFDL